MQIEPCTMSDYVEILAQLAAFWGSDRTRPFHHTIFVREFGNSAFVVRDADVVVAYLFGFRSQSEAVGYVHLVAVRQGYQRKGLGQRLYRRFIEFARIEGCREIRAITKPDNYRSIAFHTSIGMKMLGEPNAEGTPIVRDYCGPGEDRVVFRMSIEGTGASQSSTERLAAPDLKNPA